MNTQTYYRVCHKESLQGLWYDFTGDFTGLIHDRFNFCQNTKLEMHHDPEIVGWLSAVKELDELYKWFSVEDIKQLQAHGWYIHEFSADQCKHYARFNHTVIDQESAKVIRVIEIN